jgi:hypothetical protein
LIVYFGRPGTRAASARSQVPLIHPAQMKGNTEVLSAFDGALGSLKIGDLLHRADGLADSD